MTREVDRRAVDAEAVAEEFEDPEAGPALPSAALAAHAGTPAPAGAHRLARDGRREIWALSWPVMFSQVLLNAVSLIDIAMVGRLGSDAVAAVGYATQFFFLSQSVLFAVGFACVALMARAIGGGDPPASPSRRPSRWRGSPPSCSWPSCSRHRARCCSCSALDRTSSRPPSPTCPW
jgi:hypothetical protein